MLRTITPTASEPVTLQVARDTVLPSEVVWIDLVSPTDEEEAFVERTIGYGVPTRDEMSEIEPSSRLYTDRTAIYLTANILTGVDADEPESEPVTFVLTPAHLITIRYCDPKPFRTFIAHAGRQTGLCADATLTLVHLLDAIVDRLADMLQDVGSEMDAISKATFRRSKGGGGRITNNALTVLLTRIGKAQDIVSKARDSAVSLARLLSFLSFALKTDADASHEHIKSLTRDVASLTDHATYLGGNVTFLLDAALGLINIEQNAIIKIFSVAAVIFMPPTLVASIYGMNFEHMPELKWLFGYPYAIGAMILSAILPYTFFKRQGWL